MGIQQRVSDSKKIGTITGSNLSFVSVAATFTSVTYANNGGRVQFSSAGVHGLTTSPSAGARVYVSWSGAGASGVNGFYDVYSVDTTTTFTISLTHAAGLGTPTIALAGTAVTLTETVTLPGNSLGLSGILEIRSFGTIVASTNNKLIQTVFGGTTLNFINTSGASNVTFNQVQQIINENGSTSAQRCTGTVATSGPNTASFVSSSIDTTADVTIAMRLTAAAANEPIRVYGVMIRLL